METYNIPQEKADNIPGFYMPGAEEYAEGLTFIERREFEGTNPPRVIFEVNGFPGSRCELKLGSEWPRVESITLDNPDRLKINEVKKTLEGVLNISLE